MSSLPTVLFFTYPEHGQANVNLAITYELALAGVNVYIASFGALRARVLRLQELVVRYASRSGGGPMGCITFYECKGITPYLETLAKHAAKDAILSHPPGLFGALQGYSRLDVVLFPWSGKEYLAAVERIKEMIGAIKPDLVAVDGMFYFARDACKLVGQKFIVTSPNSIKDIAVNAQPYLAALWKYPVSCSGFAFPLKWWQIPLNIYLRIRLIMRIMSSVNFKRIRALRSSLGLKTMFGGKPHSELTYIYPALVETDFPFTYIPKQLVLCGPIVLPFDSLEESDPALKKWLDNGPTVMINLGSHFIFDDKYAMEMASAIRILLGHHDRTGSNKIQVLWKAKANGDIQTTIDQIIGKEVKEGRVKVLAWLEAEPVSILQHPNVVCTVHHGGANSFYEGVWSGMPHIVLPAWLDTYDYANRVEFLDIGLFGNKISAPGVQAEEFGRALVRVTGDPKEATKFRTAAKRLQEICRVKGNGRKLAAAAILKTIGIGK